MTLTKADVMNTIEQLADTPMTICLDGAGGSGKSTLADEIMSAASLPEQQLIRSDWYFELWDDPEAHETIGFFNDERFMEEVGMAINQGATPTVIENEIKTGQKIERPSPNSQQLIVVEGIKTLGLPIEWGLGVWVETPRDIRQERFMQRAVSQRRSGVTDTDVLLRSFNAWADDAEAYRQTVLEGGKADVFIQGTDPVEKQLAVLSIGLSMRTD